MNLTTAHRGRGMKRDRFQMATTSSNGYYPFYTMCGDLRPIGNEFVYHKPSIKGYYNVIGRYDQLLQDLHSSDRMDRFEFVYSDVMYHIYAMKHCIMDTEGDFLLLMTFKEREFFQEASNERKREFRKDEMWCFKLFVSTKLMLDARYTNLWKKLDKEYVSECYKKGVAVEFTTSEEIDVQVFSNNFNPTYPTISQFMRHLKEDVPRLLMDAMTTSLEDPVEDEMEDEGVEMYTHMGGTISGTDIRISSQDTIQLSNLNVEQASPESYTVTLSNDAGEQRYIAGVDSFTSSADAVVRTEYVDIVSDSTDMQEAIRQVDMPIVAPQGFEIIDDTAEDYQEIGTFEADGQVEPDSQ
jgi:hypothetical protein